MAKKQGIAGVTLNIAAGDEDFEDPFSGVSIEDLAFGEYAARLDEKDRYSFKVYRDVGSNNLEDLFQFDPASMDYDTMVEKVRSEYGAGIYRLQIRVNKVIRRNEQFRIGASLIKPPSDRKSVV